MLVYIPSIWPITWLIEKKGLRIGVTLGALFNMLGAWIKCVALEIAEPAGISTVGAHASFGVLMLGQACCGLTQTFVLSIPPELAVTWFGVREVTMATSLGVFANQVSQFQFVSFFTTNFPISIFLLFSYQ